MLSYLCLTAAVFAEYVIQSVLLEDTEYGRMITTENVLQKYAIRKTPKAPRRGIPGLRGDLKRKWEPV